MLISLLNSLAMLVKAGCFIFSLREVLGFLFLLPSLLILPPNNLSTMDHHHKKDASLYAYPLHDSTFNCATTTFFAFLGEWAILVVTCTIALFFIPLTPGFTLHSTTASVLNVNGGENHFTANLSVGILVDDSNPLGSSIYYDSLHLSLFQGQDNLSTFSLQQEPTKITAIQAKYPNVSLKIDEWGNDVDAVVQVHGTSCGFVYLDLWFSANARYTQPMWPAIRDKLQGHCGEVKVELCSSSATVFHSFLASCHVYSAVVHKLRLLLFLLLILLLLTAVALPLLLEHFFCSSTLYLLE